MANLNEYQDLMIKEKLLKNEPFEVVKIMIQMEFCGDGQNL